MVHGLIFIETVRGPLYIEQHSIKPDDFARTCYL